MLKNFELLMSSKEHSPNSTTLDSCKRDARGPGKEGAWNHA